VIASLLDKLDVATVTRGRIDARNEENQSNLNISGQKSCRMGTFDLAMPRRK